MVKVIVDDVTKIFPPRTIALRDVNLEIKDGEFMVILGPSGSGKTTLLRIIAGLEVPTKGRVMLGNRVVADGERRVFIPPKDRNVGMVFQNWALYPHMKVFDNIAYPLKLKKLPKNEIIKKVKEVAEALGIGHLLDRYPRQLSGGQQQRVALARALVKEPDVLLLDEPFSNLDARIRVSAREFVRAIQRKLKITAIFVTHDQADAYALADRIAIIKDGLLQQVATPVEIYEKPKNLFVAHFIGEPPINLIKGVIEFREGKVLFKAGELTAELPRSYAEPLRGYEGKEVIMGVRPTEVYITLNPEPHLIKIPGGVVRVVEFLGFAPFAMVTFGDIELRVSHRAYPKIGEGEKTDIYVDPHKLKIFDPKTEKLIIG